MADHYYQNESELLVLEVNPALIEPELKYEDLMSEGVFYPHVYGALNREAISQIVKIPRQNGEFNGAEI